MVKYSAWLANQGVTISYGKLSSTPLCYSAVPRKNERVMIRNRIPQEVRDEITAATRNAQPHKVANSILYLYFVWADSGIKLHWRLKRGQQDGSFIMVREGGDAISPPTER